MNLEMATIDHPQVLEGEELLPLQETASRESSSSFFNEPVTTANRFSHLHLNNHPLRTSSVSAPSFSFGSHKRSSSENPTTHLEPNPKKPNNHPRSSVSDLVPSPAKTFSSYSDSPHAEMSDCMREISRKWDELLGDEEDPANEEINNNDNDNSNGVNKENNNDETMDHSDAGFVEAVSVEKRGEALILHFKCPCGTGYQILLLGGNRYYKLM